MILVVDYQNLENSKFLCIGIHKIKLRNFTTLSVEIKKSKNSQSILNIVKMLY